jgi:hypothetical protein
MSGYIGTQPVPQATQTRDSFTATSGQTSFATGGYTPNFLDVYLNGVKLASADYTATNGSDVVLASGAATGDILEVVAYTTFTVGSSFTPSIDDNGNATALTIDSSEKVLIGKTSAGYNVDGFEARQNGETYVSRSGTPMAINRNSSDGTLLNFYKDGGGVGSIYNGGGNLGVNSSGGLLLVDDIITPTSGADATHDIGRSSARYKDAYLSGGVYLGGTGSANKLDDYEEGTWTPQLSSDVSITSYTILNGYYTKVGRLVTVSATVQAASLGSWSGASIGLYGLPFTVSNDSNNEAVGTLAMRGTTGDKDGLYIRFIQNGTYMRLEHRTGYQSHDPNMPANTIDTGTKIYVTGSYFVA